MARPSESLTPSSSSARSIAGRVAIVTGAASGMGRATAELFVAEGARVVGVDRHPEVVEVAERAAASGSGKMVAVEADLADGDQILNVVSVAREQFGPVDILINNAGVSVWAPIDDPDFMTSWETTFAVNLDAQMHLMRACLDDLLRNADGRVVNIASTEGLGATPQLAAYTASKHAVVGLTKSMAVELGPAGVTVNCICPGPIRTGMTDAIPEEHKAKYVRRRVPLRRYGEPAEVAHMTLSLVLPAASFITGAIIPVDGGLSSKFA